MNTPPTSDETIFAAALVRPAAERTAYLEAACGGDASRRARIEDLLRAHEAAEQDFMRTAASASPRIADLSAIGLAAAEPVAGEKIGRYKLLQKIGEGAGLSAVASLGNRIGRYKLLQKLGEGGCGIVYMAEQEEPVRRRVALKVIKLGMDTKEVIARFEAERQALALMDHPNIARVFDGGATDAGRPFFVMELVRGVPITKFCDEQNLTTSARLELFTLVCHAVQHAHQKGIIHRDLKPSNILVTLHDGVAVPKVIDFGIAKATHGRLTDNTLFTAFEQFIGTPAYMSPEQAEMSGLDIDTRSDIYSLGVLLYELLTGRPPFDPQSLVSAGLDEIRRIIREVEPPRPSTRLSTLTDLERATIAKLRGILPGQLSTLLRGDLDWIVMRCLEKDRTRRYETANGLALDVLRHLHDEPVVARPPSAGYRLHKLVRRHRLAVGACAAIVMVLLAGIAVSTWQAVRATRAEKLAASRLDSELVARRDADQQRRLAIDRLASEAIARRDAENQRTLAEAESVRARGAEKSAQSESKKSALVATFMTDMLKGVGPAVALGRDTALLREITSRTARQLDDLKDEPAVEADLRFTLGLVYFDLGEYPRAIAMQRSALGLRKRLLGDEHLDVAAAQFHLAGALSAESKYPEAESVQREALALRRKILGAEHADVAASLNQLGEAIRRQGSQRFAEGEVLMRESLAMRRGLFGNEHLDVAASLADLGLLLFRRSTYIESEAMQREALAIRRTLLGDEHPEVATALDRLALAVNAQRRYEEAQAIYREALSMRRKLLGSEHPDVAHTLHNLANAVRAVGGIAEAEILGREALDIRRKRLGSDHYEVGFSLNALALHIRQQGRFVEAEALQREALEIYRKTFPEGNVQLVGALTGLTSDLRAQRKLAEAEPYLREALAVQRKLADVNPSTLASKIRALAGLLRELGNSEEAVALEREIPATAPPVPRATASAALDGVKHIRTDTANTDGVTILDVQSEVTGIAGQYRLTVRVKYSLASVSKGSVFLALNHTAPNFWTRMKSQSVGNGSGECEFVLGVVPPSAGHALRAQVTLAPDPRPPDSLPLASHRAAVTLK